MTSSDHVGRGLKIAAAIAVLFGAVTILSGGRVLLGASDAGDTVATVLWFNTLSGPIYILAGIGLFLGHDWGRLLAWLLFAGLVVVFAVFGLHVAGGGAYEMRTVGAMVLRTGFWLSLALAAQRARKD